MQLREAESLGAFNQNDRGVRHVHADLNHRGRDQNLDFARAERFHDFFFFLREHFSVEHGDFEFRKNIFRKSLVFFLDGAHQVIRILYARAEYVGLAPG